QNVVPADDKFARRAQRLEAGVEGALAVDAVVESPAEHAVADDQVEAARRDVDGEVFKPGDDVPACTEALLPRVGVYRLVDAVGERLLVVPGVPGAADEEHALDV